MIESNLSAHHCLYHSKHWDIGLGFLSAVRHSNPFFFVKFLVHGENTRKSITNISNREQRKAYKDHGEHVTTEIINNCPVSNTRDNPLTKAKFTTFPDDVIKLPHSMVHTCLYKHEIRKLTRALLRLTRVCRFLLIDVYCTGLHRN